MVVSIHIPIAVKSCISFHVYTIIIYVLFTAHEKQSDELVNKEAIKIRKK